MSKRIVRVQRKHEELSYEFDGTVDAAILMLRRLKAETPEGATLYLSYETEYGTYGDPDRQKIFLYDQRMETDEEYDIRLAEEHLAREGKIAQKRAQLERLKKELGEE